MIQLLRIAAASLLAPRPARPRPRTPTWPQPGRHLRQLPRHQRPGARRHEAAGRRVGRQDRRHARRLQERRPARDDHAPDRQGLHRRTDQARSPRSSPRSRPRSEEPTHEHTSNLRRRHWLGAGAALAAATAGRLRRHVVVGPVDRPRRRRRRRLRRRHRGALPAAVGRQRRRHAGRAQRRASSPARSATWCSAATSRWPTSRAATAASKAVGVKVHAGRGHGHRRGRQEGAPGRRRASCPTTGWCCRPASTSCPTRSAACRAALDSGRVLHSWKAGPQTVALRRQIEAMPDGGVFAMFIPKAPYRCPPGPYERACMVASYLKTAKPKSKVLVLDANPEITVQEGAVREGLQASTTTASLEYRPNAELKELSGNVAKLEFEDVKADVLNVIPPQRAGDLARSAGLLNMNNRWVGVNWLTMESTAAPGIHVLGDATFSAPADAQVGPHGQPARQGGGGGDHPAAQGRGGERRAGGDEHLLQLRHRAAT